MIDTDTAQNSIFSNWSPQCIMWSVFYVLSLHSLSQSLFRQGASYKIDYLVFYVLKYLGLSYF